MSLENFTGYTETDPNSRLTVTANEIDVVGMKANEDAYVYADKGVDYFNALDIDFEVYVASGLTAWSRGIIGVSNSLDDFAAWASGIGVIPGSNAAGNMLIYLALGGWGTEDISINLNFNTIYYLTLSRVAGNNTVNLYIYSDSARTTLVDTVTVAGVGTQKWRYIYGLVSTNQAIDGRAFTGSIKNLNLNAAGTNMKVNVGDTWKAVSAAKINVVDTWKAVAKAKVNVADTWKTIF